MEKISYLFLLLIILVIILILKLYLENTYNTWLIENTQKSNKISNISSSNISNSSEFENMLNQMRTITNEKINAASESGFIEGFKSMNGEGISDSINNSDRIIPYTSNTNTTKIMLFYKAKCPYCIEFLPIWYKIINNLPNNVMYEEIECDRDSKKATEYKITTVPTIILLINNDKSIYIGDRSYNNIKKFLKLNGVNIIERTFEEFDSTGYSTSPDPTQPVNPNCPAVTFDKQLDVADDNYMFQIFNSDGQYGYATGGMKAGKLINPFNAAYSAVDSYLSSLPDPKDSTKNSYANANECAKLYAKEIRSFGLCDSDSLNNILSYNENIKNGLNVNRIDGTDYSSNNTVVSAIKSACQL